MDLLEFLSQKIRQAPEVQKRRYRPDMIKALINSYPEGVPISTAEIQAAVQLSPNSTNSMLWRLMDRGEISRKKVKSGLNTYKVLIPGRTYDKEREDLALRKEGYVNPAMVHAQRLRRAKEAELLKSEPEETDTPKEVQTFLEKHLPDQRTYTFDELEELAMKHVFYSPESSIAEFIKTLKEN